MKKMFLNFLCLVLVCRIFSWGIGQGQPSVGEARRQIGYWIKNKKVVFVVQSTGGNFNTTPITYLTIIAEEE